MMNVPEDWWPFPAVDADSNEGENKVMWVSTWFKNRFRRWFSIDPRSESDSGKVREIGSTRCEEGSKLDTVRLPCVAVVGSNIYVFGGVERDTYVYPGRFFKEVHVYNVKTATWSEAPPLNHPRAFPFAFVIKRKIYVFGTKSGARIPMQDWVECYDHDSPGSGWETFSGPILDEETTHPFLCAPLYAGVVYHDQILFWGPSTAGIFAFNLSSNTWSFTKADQVPFLRDGISPTPAFNFMSNHVVCGHLVLWQLSATLYAWDLTNNTTKELCTLKGVHFPEPFDPGLPNHYPGPSKLLQLGNGLLCLLRWRMTAANTTQICCYKFQIDEGTGGAHPVGIQYYYIPGHLIEHAILLSAGSMGGTGDASLVKNEQLSSG